MGKKPTTAPDVMEDSTNGVWYVSRDTMQLTGLQLSKERNRIVRMFPHEARLLPHTQKKNENDTERLHVLHSGLP